MPSFECRKCLPVNVPDNWTDEKKAEVAALIRESDSFLVVSRFRSSDMDLSDAKGIFLHVSRNKGFCHHCGKELTDYEGQCPKCKRLNLDW